jgi:hypothetical protein
MVGLLFLRCTTISSRHYTTYRYDEFVPPLFLRSTTISSRPPTSISSDTMSRYRRSFLGLPSSYFYHLICIRYDESVALLYNLICIRYTMSRYRRSFLGLPQSHLALLPTSISSVFDTMSLYRRSFLGLPQSHLSPSLILKMLIHDRNQCPHRHRPKLPSRSRLMCGPTDKNLQRFVICVDCAPT